MFVCPVCYELVDVPSVFDGAEYDCVCGNRLTVAAHEVVLVLEGNQEHAVAGYRLIASERRAKFGV